MSENKERSVRDNPPISVTALGEVVEEQYVVLFDDITANGTTIQFVDRHALGQLAIILCEMSDLRLELVDKGEAMKVEGDRGMVTKRNPARDALQKLYSVMLKLFGDFNMTPKSRGNNFSGKGESSQTTGDEFDQV